MKAEQRTVFVARDGRDFPTKAKCLAHERDTCGAALVGLTEAQVEAARTWADPELAEAFEMFGYGLRKRARAPASSNDAGGRTGPKAGARRSAWRTGANDQPRRHAPRQADPALRDHRARPPADQRANPAGTQRHERLAPPLNEDEARRIGYPDDEIASECVKTGEP